MIYANILLHKREECFFVTVSFLAVKLGSSRLLQYCTRTIISDFDTDFPSWNMQTIILARKSIFKVDLPTNNKHETQGRCCILLHSFEVAIKIFSFLYIRWLSKIATCGLSPTCFPNGNRLAHFPFAAVPKSIHLYPYEGQCLTLRSVLSEIFSKSNLLLHNFCFSIQENLFVVRNFRLRF